ncbi:MAG: hypothetical protein WA160_12305 [Pseudobdellovibrio sp.]
MIHLVICCLLFSPFALKAEEKNQIQRQELFVRAFKSLHYVLLAARQDPIFLKSLSSDEIIMLNGIGAVAAFSSTFDWLLKNNVQRFGEKHKLFYSYVVTQDRVLNLRLPFEKPTYLQFSDDQSIFMLDPDQPTRSGMTHGLVEDDIFLNIKKINDPTALIDFASATSLLMHEMGHKLGAEKNQNAIDSAAAKIENLVRSSTNTVEFNGKKISTLIFKNFNFFDWVKAIAIGNFYENPANPPVSQPLISFDQQGLYAWVDDGKKVTDLTQTLIDSFGQSKTIQLKSNPNFQYLNQTLIQPKNITIFSDINGDIKFSIHGTLNKFIIPFYKQNSPDPQKVKLYETSFNKKDTAIERILQQDISLNANTYQLKNISSSPIIEQAPDLKVEYIDKKAVGRNLEIYFKVLGNRGFDASKDELWPEINIKMDHSIITIKASSFDKKEDIFKFIIKDFDSIESKDVRINSIQFRLKNPILAIPYYDYIYNAFLHSEIILTNSVPLENKINVKPVLKSIRIWDGLQWLPFKQKKAIPSGSNLRFIFESSETLRQLRLNQKYFSTVILNRTLNGISFQQLYKDSEQEERQLIFEEMSLKQTLEGKYLYVDFDIDHLIKLEHLFEFPVVFEGAKNPEMMPKEIQHQIHTVESERLLSGSFSIVTKSGITDEFYLKNELPFSKVTIPMGTNNLHEFKNASCKRLFQH